MVRSALQLLPLCERRAARCKSSGFGAFFFPACTAACATEQSRRRRESLGSRRSRSGCEPSHARLTLCLLVRGGKSRRYSGCCDAVESPTAGIAAVGGHAHSNQCPITRPTFVKDDLCLLTPLPLCSSQRC